MVSFRPRTFLLRLLPSFLRGVTACLVVAACLILLISPSTFHGKCARNVVNWQAERDNGSRAECPRRIRPSSPGGPKGVITSYLPIDKRGADLLFQVVAARYERGSIVISTNRAFRDWGAIFDVDNTLATAMIDRLMHHGEAIVIQGDSYRTKDKPDN